MKIGIFGGSFNPVHKSHIKIAEKLIENKYVHKVWMLPCYKSLHGKELISDMHRLQMLTTGIRNSKYVKDIWACPFEIIRKMSGKTIDVVTTLSKLYKKSYREFSFVIGMDNALSITKFKDWEKLISSAQFIVLNRNDYKILGNEWFMKKPHIFADDIIVDDASSTYIRDSIKNLNLDKNFFNVCSKDVFKYIINNNLYGWKGM